MAETRTRDLWDKVDILAKIMTPVVLFVFGTLYNMHQNEIAEAQKASDRVASLVKSLSSQNVEERRTALALLSYEKSKHPGVVPDELLTGLLPALVQLAKTERNAEVAKAAEQLATDVVSHNDVGLKNAVQDQVHADQGHIFMHIRDEGQRSDARRIAALLEDKGYVIPVSERVNAGPAATEVRFFRKAEEQEANEITSLVQSLKIVDAKAKYMPGFEDSKQRKRTFEIWFSSGSLRQPLLNTSTQRSGSESQ